MAPWLGMEETAAVRTYMESGGWLTEFEKTREFEAMVARYVGHPYCVATVNGTIALTMGLLALGIGPGDEVIVPDYSMIASANAVVLAGATPVLVDIEPATLCVDLDAAAEAVSPHTRALMMVSINGRAPDMDTVVAFCGERGLHLVEDAAQSLGSGQRGRHLGTFGAVGCFSFSAPKVITTGQGGAIVTGDPAVYERLRLIKDFGRRRPGVDHHIVVGFNFKFTDLQAVVGIEQMKKLPWRVERKKAIYGLYRRLLQDIGGVEFPPTDLLDTSPWFVDVLVAPGTRRALIDFLDGRGIGTRPFYPPIHTQASYAGLEHRFPRASEVSACGLWLPSSSALTDADVAHVSEAIRGFFDG